MTTENGPLVRRRKGGLEGFQPRIETTPTLSDTVTDTLRRSIIRGDVAAGVHLAEEELATRLAVSRGPVRQALARLEHEGLVRILPRRGGVVLGFTDRDVHEIYDMRRLMESRAAFLVAAEPDPDALEELRARAQGFSSIFGEAEFEREIDHDLAFHRHLVAMTGHRRLLAAWEPLTATVRALLAVTRARMPGLAAAHQDVVRAVEQRDPVMAEHVVVTHLDRAEGLIIAAREQRGTTGHERPPHARPPNRPVPQK